jgi:hypothetical protein
MTKTDKSMHNICIAAIKRNTMKPYEFKWTKFYEDNTDFQYTGLEIDLADNELFICSTFIDQNNFSILTTRRILTKQEGRLCLENIKGATNKLYGDFKGYRDEEYTFGLIQLQNGNEIRYFIETGKASMVVIHGLRTLIRTNEMTPNQVDNIGRVWNNRPSN